jgi:hypothetical protein
MKNLDDGPDGLNEAAFDRALGVKPAKVNYDVECAKGEIISTKGDALLGGIVCSGCGHRFGGHGMRAINAHHRAAKRRAAKAAS